MGWCPRSRRAFFGLAVFTICLGLLVYLGGGALPAAPRDMLGDALWAVMMVWCVSVIAPNARLVTRGAIALAVCWTVEVSQLHHTPFLDALRATLPGHLVLGSGFDPRDLAAYAVGVIAALVFEAAACAGRGPTRMRSTCRSSI